MFDWDEEKRRLNREKHGVDFAEAGGFDWSRAVIRPDRRRDYGEPRIEAVAPIGLRLHVLIYTLRAGRVRIISLRKANRREIAEWLTTDDGT